MDGRPIGVFDSGVGGLTVLHELLVTLPHEDAVYLGDNARLPYGPRPLDEVRGFALEIGARLEDEGVKLVVVACNSATAAGLPDLQRALRVPVVGVLQPEAHAAALATRNRRVGLLATEATVASRRYEELVHAYQALAYRAAYVLTGSAADAEESAQLAFVKAWAALPRFRPGAEFRPWLMRIVANEAHNRRRSTRRREALTLRAFAADVSGGAVPSPEASVVEDERRRALLDAVNRLPERDRVHPSD